ncbi:hypothetical protein EIP91_001832 [Steccherinum ochraceum]|uniref:Protein kinase domain-containing protein n=1 Tax=Steccherinum ochraceum TaxID=92696 RepID=A0A4R0RTZ0_9APHY|nr:hypothetical protein EIP91_001832 [Steccherinum ochraceum]
MGVDGAAHVLSSSRSVQVYIKAALKQPEGSKLMTISSKDAQTVLDEIWKVLDSAAFPVAAVGGEIHRYRNQLRKLSLKLSITHGILPTLVLLEGVQTEGQQAGAGAFADVYIGTLHGEKVALKRLRVYLMATEGQKEQMKQLFYRESLLWKNLMHDHIVPFIGVAETVFPGTVCMVLPWMENGSLRHYVERIRNDGKLVGKEYVRAMDNWLFQIADGLLYLHDEGLVHGDLHGGNILIDDEGNARLTDFGMALLTESTAYGYASLHGGGAIRWKAPELSDPEEYGVEGMRPTPASDVFSFSCMVIELHSGKPPMPGITDNQVARRYVKGTRPDRPVTPDGDTVSDALWSLTEACWSQTVADRPSAKEVVRQMAAIAGAQGYADPLPEQPVISHGDADSLVSSNIAPSISPESESTLPPPPFQASQESHSGKSTGPGLKPGSYPFSAIDTISNATPTIAKISRTESAPADYVPRSLRRPGGSLDQSTGSGIVPQRDVGNPHDYTLQRSTFPLADKLYGSRLAQLIPDHRLSFGHSPSLPLVPSSLSRPPSAPAASAATSVTGDTVNTTREGSPGPSLRTPVSAYLLSSLPDITSEEVQAAASALTRSTGGRLKAYDDILSEVARLPTRRAQSAVPPPPRKRVL